MLRSQHAAAEAEGEEGAGESAAAAKAAEVVRWREERRLSVRLVEALNKDGLAALRRGERERGIR